MKNEDQIIKNQLELSFTENRRLDLARHLEEFVKHVTKLSEELAVSKLRETLTELLSSGKQEEVKQAVVNLAKKEEKTAAPRKRKRHYDRKDCYYPGCHNVAAPRYGMFCAQAHKDIPAEEKTRLRVLKILQSAGGKVYVSKKLIVDALQSNA